MHTAKFRGHQVRYNRTYIIMLLAEFNLMCNPMDIIRYNLNRKFTSCEGQQYAAAATHIIICT